MLINVSWRDELIVGSHHKAEQHIQSMTTHTQQAASLTKQRKIEIERYRERREKMKFTIAQIEQDACLVSLPRTSI